MDILRLNPLKDKKKELSRLKQWRIALKLAKRSPFPDTRKEAKKKLTKVEDAIIKLEKVV